MIDSLLAFLGFGLPQILTSLTLILIGGWLFEARDGFFLSGGQFKGKIAGLVILLTAVIVASAATPLVENVWAMIATQLGSSQIVGFVIIVGMAAVNKSAEWNYFDRKSMVVYIIGLILIAQPSFLTP